MAQPQVQRQQHHATPMEQLQGMLNVVLMHIGTVVNDPTKRRDPNVRMQIATVLPSAMHRFHEALDKLEDELNRARSVMRRDLGLLESEREKKEREEAEARQQAASRDTREGVEKVEKPAGAQEDGIVANDAFAPTRIEANVSPEAFSAPVAPMGQIAKPQQAEPQQVQVPALAESRGQESSKSTSAPPADAVLAPTAINPASTNGEFTLDATAPTSQGGFDFDSMFAYTDPTGNGEDAMGGAEDLTSLDVNSLLPGIENYATMTEGVDGETTTNPSVPALGGAGELDFSMLGITAASGAEHGQGDQAHVTEQAAQQNNATQESAMDVNLNFDIGDLPNGDGADGNAEVHDTTLDDLFNDLENFTYEGNADGTGAEGNGNGEDLFDFFNS